MSRRFNLIFPFAILLLTFLSYSPLFHAGFIWDDDNYLTENATLTRPDALSTIWLHPSQSPQYYPLVFTSFLAEAALWGLAPLGYHLLNILLHAGSAILLWLILRRLRVPGAPLAAALFALHPVAAESVAWITERKNTFACFFLLASLLAYLRFALPSPEAVALPKKHWRFYALSLLLFTLAMLSKTVACGLPVIFILLLWWKRHPLRWRDLANLLPFFLLGAALGLNTAFQELHHVGAQGKDFDFLPIDRLIIAGHALWFYVAKILFPTHLAFYYTRWTIDRHSPLQYLYPAAALLAFLILFLARRRLGKAPLVAALSFFVLLFPALGFFNIYPMIFSFVADHFQYLALIALIPLFAAILTHFTPPLIRNSPLLATLASVPLLALLGFLTFRSAQRFHDPRTLWISVIQENQHWAALEALAPALLQDADELRKQGQPPSIYQRLIDQAVTNLRRALDLHPQFPEAHSTLAVADAMNHDLPDALQEARTGAQFSPNSGAAQATLGDILFQSHDYPAALAAYTQAINLHLQRANLYYQRGRIYFLQNDDANAQRDLQTAATLDPHFAPAFDLLGSLLAQHNDLRAAADAFAHALTIDPTLLTSLDGFARSVALLPDASPTDLTQALDASTRAVDLTHRQNPDFLDTLALLKNRTGDPAAAIAITQQTLTQFAPRLDQWQRHSLEQHLAAYQAATRPQ